MSGTYSGSDKRLAYLFENGGGGGGGTTVIANPSGEATDDLEKLQVGETIYDIPTGGSSTLAGLGDVNLSSPTDGQVLKYDATNDEWVNGEGGSGGSVLYLNTIYSETEEKIGYWTDGKPLYQKTVAVTANIPYNEWSSTGVVVDPNADRVITIPQARPQSGSSDMHFLAYFGTGGELIVMNMRNVNYGNNYAFYITVQYTKTTDTPEIPQRGNVIYLPTIYSQEEREVGVWTDGKPLYQRTLVYNDLSQTSDWTELDNSVSYEMLIKVVGQRIAGNGDVLGFANSLDVTPRFMVRPTDGKLYYYTNNSIAGTIYITIQYTKTTDTAGSGSWTPSGAPAVHYSTEEHVVGTWVDGSTLYEKSIVTTITNGTQWVDTGIDSTCNITHVEGVLTETGGNNICIPSPDPQEQIGFNVSAVGVVTSDKWSVLFRTTNTNSRGGLVATFQYTKSS